MGTANDESTNTFLDAINKYAQQQKEEILKEVEDFRAKEIEKAEKEALNSSYRMIQNAIEQAKRQAAGKISNAQLENKKKLLAERDRITKETFILATKKIMEIKKTGEYIDWLAKQANEAIGVFNSKIVTVYLNKEDMALSGKLKKKIDKNYDVKFEEDSTIKIGGLKISSEGESIVVDQTLDSKLVAQMDWFEENSNLHI